MVAVATSIARQSARRAELDHIRLTRPLTPDEAREAENLAQRLYMREWRRTAGVLRPRAHHAP